MRWRREPSETTVVRQYTINKRAGKKKLITIECNSSIRCWTCPGIRLHRTTEIIGFIRAFPQDLDPLTTSSTHTAMTSLFSLFLIIWSNDSERGGKDSASFALISEKLIASLKKQFQGTAWRNFFWEKSVLCEATVKVLWIFIFLSGLFRFLQ